MGAIESYVPLTIKPITMAEARRFVAGIHRHNDAPIAHVFSISVVDEDGCIRGVAMAERPKARLLNDGWTLEISRVATDGTRNANSILYGASCRTARALGYRRVVTYTLESESGISLRAAGFMRDGPSGGGRWDRPNQARLSTESWPAMFFDSKRSTEPKVRWSRSYAAAALSGNPETESER